MKINFLEVLKMFIFPILITAILATLLLVFGIELDTVIKVAGSMVALQLVFGLLIDLLKTAGVIGPGEAPNWNKGASLLTMIGVAVALGFKPDFDFPSLDKKFSVIYQVLVLAITFTTQIIGTKNTHTGLVEGLDQRQFQLTPPVPPNGDG